MGSSKKLPDIAGHLYDKRGIYQLVISAGYLNNQQRNRISVTTGLVTRGNARKANSILRETINLLKDAMDMTGVISLKELYRYVSDETEKDIPTSSYSQKESVTNDVKDNPAYSAVIDEWLMYEKTRVSANLASKWSYAAKHVKAYFREKAVGIQDLTSRHIAQYYAAKINGDPENDIKGLSPRTVKDHREVIQGSIKYAIEIMKLIQANPADSVPAPKGETRPPSYYTQAQINQVLQMIQGTSIEAAVVLAANFGLRRQEVMGLKWNAVDLEKRSLSVRHTVTRVNGEDVSADRTKSRSSLRTLPVPENVADYLIWLKARQQAMQEEMGNSYEVNDYIVKWDDGSRMSPDYVTKKWRLFLKANELPHITFHDIRHSFASLLIKLGFTLKEVQEWLGHYDIALSKYRIKCNILYSRVECCKGYILCSDCLYFINMIKLIQTYLWAFG